MSTATAPEQTPVRPRGRGRRRAAEQHQAAAPAGTPPARGVNLLSPWVRQEIRVRRIRKRLLHGLLALLVLVAGAWTFQQLRLSAARSDLRGEVAVGDGLRTQIAALDEVTTYVSDVRLRAETVRGTMATQIGQADALRALARATPADTTLDSVSFTLPVPGVPLAEEPAVEPSVEDLLATRGIVAACPGPDPFGTRVVVACLLVTGTAPDRQSVSALVQRLGEDDLFVEPFVDTTTTEEGLVTFTGSVGISPDAFTQRYDAVAPAPVAEPEVAR
jgi:hypothetical protein